mmetsp:Transcript_22890/g.41353  ORF Transcript_22890/g.41353 Transcript_22890/m.41353 type:complete len:243 (-) Transcript_22890:51-779(-)
MNNISCSVLPSFFSLERVVADGLHEVSDSTIACGHSLCKESRGRPHGQPSVRHFLCLQPHDLSLVHLKVSKRIKAKVTGLTVATVPSTRYGNTGDHFNNRNHDEGKCDVLGMGTPELPESIHLVLGGGRLASGRRAESLNLHNACDSKHGNTAVLELSLAKPVEIDANVINIGKTQWVESNITGQGSIKKSWPVHEWKGFALLRVQGNARAACCGSRSEGRSRPDEEGSGKGSNLHHLDDSN